MAISIWNLAPDPDEAARMQSALVGPDGKPPEGIEVRSFAGSEALLSVLGFPDILYADLGTLRCHEAIAAMRERNPKLRVTLLQKLPKDFVLPPSVIRAQRADIRDKVLRETADAIVRSARAQHPSSPSRN